MCSNNYVNTYLQKTLFHKFYYLLIPWSMGVFEGDIWGECPKWVAEG